MSSVYDLLYNIYLSMPDEINSRVQEFYHRIRDKVHTLEDFKEVLAEQFGGETQATNIIASTLTVEDYVNYIENWGNPEIELEQVSLGKFEALSCKSKISLKVSQMYEYVPFEFETMVKFSELFKTKKINVGQEQSSGCETCDYGSSYEVTFSILDSGLAVDWED
jgi:hypothetical protein